MRELESNGYHISLNDKNATLIEPLGPKDPRRLLMPVQNNWNRYYFVKFDSDDNTSLALRLENNQTGSVVLNYQKYPLVAPARQKSVYK